MSDGNNENVQKVETEKCSSDECRCGCGAMVGDILQKSWKVMLTIGIIEILIGLLVLAAKPLFTGLVMLCIAIAFIVTGLVQLIQMSKVEGSGKKTFRTVMAVLYVLCGIVLLVHPASGIVTITLIIGVFFVVEGVMRLLLSLQSDFAKVFGVVNALFSIILGVLILSMWPNDSDYVLALLVGINLVVGGWMSVMFSLALKKSATN